MKKIILFIAVVFLGAFSYQVSAQETEKAGIAAAIEAGNAGDLGAFLAESLDLTLIDQEDVYSQNQAQVIINRFFSQNKPKSFEIKHEGKSKLKDFYYIGELKTDKGDFRVTFFLKKQDNGFKVKQLRIENA